MKKYLPLISAAFMLVACNPPKQPKANDIINNLVRLYNNHKAVSYYVNYTVKPFNQDIAYKYEVNCKLIRDEKDPVFNGYVWLSYNEFERYYDLQNIYYINDSTKKATVYNDPKNESWVINGNLSADAKDIYFLNPAGLADINKDTTITDSLSVDKIGYADYWKVTMRYPGDKEFSDKWRVFWVDRKDTTLKKMYYHVKFQGQDEFKEWDIDSMAFDKINPQDLTMKIKHKVSSYTVSRYIAPKDTTL